MQHIIWAWIIGLVLVFVSGVISSVDEIRESKKAFYITVALISVGFTLMLESSKASIIVLIISLGFVWLSGLILIWIFAEKKFLIAVLVLLAIGVYLTAPPGIIPTLF